MVALSSEKKTIGQVQDPPLQDINMQDWNEIHLSEDPAIELLQALGYTFAPPEQLESERESLKEIILISRPEKKLRELNPY